MVYYNVMLNNGEKLGAFIVPTGIGASIGGFAEMQVVMPENLPKFQTLLLTQMSLMPEDFLVLPITCSMLKAILLMNFLKEI
mgnify:CR=1 FL=1